MLVCVCTCCMIQCLQVTLMDWGNCIMREVAKGPDGRVTGITAALHLEGDFKKTKLKLTWLADVPDLVPLRLVTLGDLITKAKVCNALFLFLFLPLSSHEHCMGMVPIRPTPMNPSPCANRSRWRSGPAVAWTTPACMCSWRRRTTLTTL